MIMFPDHESRKQSMREQGRADIIDAHTHTVDHRAELESSSLAGCFHCIAVFEPSEIEEWVDDGKCALCPKCGIDSVIGDGSGFPVTDKQFLQEMNRFWFS
jgi:hypothetical protein